MKRKSKVLALLLCLSIFAGMALGSGSSDSDDDTKSIVTTGGSGSGSGSASSSAEATIEETVLVDQDGIKITATEYDADSIWGDSISLLIENNTDTDYTIGCDALIVNNFMITDLFVATVAAGKSANESMYLSSSELEAAGIDNVGQIEMYFHAYDDGYDNLFSDVYSVVKTSLYSSMDTSSDITGTELYNANGIRIIGMAVDEDSFWGMSIVLYCENTSDKNVTISVDDLSVNGFMMDDYFSSTIYANKKAVDDITLFSSDLEDNGIESIETVELKFKIYDADSYETIAESDAITFNAQ